MVDINIAIVGLGKIAQEQHVHAIKMTAGLDLVATVSGSSSLQGISNYHTLAELHKSGLRVDAVALCMPPVPRYSIALEAIEYGYHVLLEKPPGISINECQALIAAAKESGVTIFAAWHSKYAPLIGRARDWVGEFGCDRFEMAWKEDVYKWHPGQLWVTEAGGFGVFDPGINGLSILVELLDEPLVPSKVSFLKPKNWATPIAASFQLLGRGGLIGSVEVDWRSKGDEIWDIRLFSGKRSLHLSDGGARLVVDGEILCPAKECGNEYESVYRDFYLLLKSDDSAFDIRPLELVADLFLSAIWDEVKDFDLV